MFNNKIFQSLICSSVVVIGCFTGCGTVVPENQPVTVVVKSSNGEPMEMVKVKFIPQAEGLDGNYIATGVTGEDGSCAPTVPGNPKVVGIPAGEHMVLVTEGPISAEAQAAEDRNDQSLAKAELKLRKNRPIPPKYTRILSTPLKAEVSEGTLKIEFILE